MVLNESSIFGPKKPKGYKVAPQSYASLRSIAEQLCKLPEIAQCYKGPAGHFIDAIHLLENVLPRANYNVHPVEDDELTETAAFTVPEKNLIVLRNSIYEGLFTHDPFSRYTVVHEFSHIVLNHAITLHRGAVLGEHRWFEDSEWQANNLAAEIMMSVATVKALGCDVHRIATSCGVSTQAAQYRVNNLRRERVI